MNLIPNHHPFHEYDYVLRHTEDLDRLRELSNYRVDRVGATTILYEVARRLKWKSKPELRFTGRTDRGMYYSDLVIIRPTPSVAVLVHELAHHEHRQLQHGAIRWTKHSGKGHGSHSGNFVIALDRVAAIAIEIVKREEGK